MDEIKVEKMSYLAQVNIVDGVPQCYCCAEPMVQVEPGQWMCVLGVAMLTFLRDASRRMDAVVLD